MVKLLFSTGVRQSPDSSLFGPYQKWIGGVKQIEFFVKEEPVPGATFLHALDNPGPNEYAIEIVGGGLLSKFAVFSKGK